MRFAAVNECTEIREARGTSGNQGRSTGSGLGEQLTRPRSRFSNAWSRASATRKSPKPSSSRRARLSGTSTMYITS